MYEYIDLAIRVMGLIAAAVFSLYQAWHLLPARRARLKLDLEILKLLDESNSLRPGVQASIEKSLKEIYGLGAPEDTSRFRVYNWGDLVMGVFFTPVFVIWTVVLVKDGFNWWSVVTCFLALGGLGGILNGFDPKRAKTTNAPA